MKYAVDKQIVVAIFINTKIKYCIAVAKQLFNTIVVVIVSLFLPNNWLYR